MRQQSAIFIVPVCWLLVLLPLPDTVRADEAAVLEQLRVSSVQYNTPEKWQARRKQLREEFLKGAQLWPLPDRPAVEAIRHSRREYDGYSVENVALETLPGFYCTGNLYRPLGRKDLDPAILCPHGHFRPLGRFREDHQIRCAHLARMGATVFSYSMVGWQDSRQTTHDDPLVLALQTWNSIRAVDFVTGLERVDANRVAITGASGGRTQALFLALVDDRVKVSAPLVIVYPWTAPDGCRCEGGLPVMQAANTNAIELAAATAPRPQLLISVGNDPTENFPNVGFPFVKRMYDVAGAGEAVKNVHFADEGHDFGPSKRKVVYEFLAEHLHMRRNAFVPFGDRQPHDLERIPEDLSRITIEPPEQMQVFNDEHPLPADALNGGMAINTAFEQHLVRLRKLHDKRAAAINPKNAPPAEYAFKTAGPNDESLIFTPTGFDKVGVPKVASGADMGTIEVVVRNGTTGQPTFCRVNVVGSDGNYYEPATHDLKRHSLTGIWPQSGWGNRQTKAPIRYLGRYFYSNGKSTVEVPAGTVRVEVWKGFEFTPATMTTHVRAGRKRTVEVTLNKSVPMPDVGYWSGDPHIHIQRCDEADDNLILDLLEAEDIHFATVLAYNNPAGPYAGFMNRMESPQVRGLGKRSIRSRGDYAILSGEEYRTATYGHLNLFLLDQLIMPDQSYNANNWPPYGQIGHKAREAGGLSFYAHGGYAQEIYADVVQGNVDGVELLQFGVYRGIGLIDWYHLLNAGFRVPATGACDYPACRKLGDCKTYVYSDRKPSIEGWLRGMADGRSFFTSGPLILLEVDGCRPGSRLDKQVDGSHRVTATVRVRSEVAPVTNVQLIANGRIVHELTVPPSAGRGNWIEFEQEIELDQSAWIAARAFSLSPLETPDAESHTNPVYIYLNGKAPYDRESLDALVAAIDGQIDVHEKREFPQRAQVIAYFERSRDILMKIREAGGVPSTGHPSEIARDDPLIIDPGAREHTDEELKAFLKPVPPKPIEDVLRSFETVDGFEMQLVAREPLVNDPIAAAFDEQGNLYVCEMRDYPYKPQPGKQPIGSLRLLKDTDGDGVFDESHVFAEQLLWTGGVVPWKGGVFVAAPPDIWYLKDTDGDNRADVRERVFTGFGTDNQQAMLNNLKWGLDHKIYGSTAGNGGTVRPGDQPDAPGITVDGRDFRFDPVTRKFETITGTVQFGNTFDDWGNRFLCSESQPLQHAVLPQHYLERNPYLAVPRAVSNIAPGPVPSYRISPLERWRQIRSSRRIAHGQRAPTSAGASHHVLDAAAGVTVYRGGAYPAEYYGNIFIGGAQNNLIHRRTLSPNGATFKSHRADEQTEFVRSSDNWFRPVNFVNAPDGTLYVLDMSREILETIHVPLDVTKFIDFKHGREHGRIYRIAPANFKYPGSPRLADATSVELVAFLESPHGWWRETAHRLIFERQDRAAVPALRQLLADSLMPQARLHALWSLDGLDSLTDEDIASGLRDAHAGVREHAMRLAEPRLDAKPKLLEQLLAQANDANPRIQLQLAFSLGASNDPRAAAALAGMARKFADDPWIRTAVLSSTNGLADRMFVEILDDRAFSTSSTGRGLLEQLLTVVGSRGEQNEIDRVLDAITANTVTLKDNSPQFQFVAVLGNAMRRTGTPLTVNAARRPETAGFLKRLFDTADHTARDEKADPSKRQAAIQLLGCTGFEAAHKTLEALIDIRQPEPVQLAAVGALSAYSDPAVSAILLDRWREHSPAVRRQITEALLSREDRTTALLRAAEAGDASVASIEMSRRALLLQHKNDTIRSLATRLFGDEVGGARADVIAEYEAALSFKSDRAHGETVFKRDCMACHKIAGTGHAVGPDLTSSASHDARALLVHVLDPNRYLLPNYEQYVCIDTSGRIVTGMITAQTATSITLKREENKTETILRGQIEELTSSGKSLMPEGLEKKLTKQDMADLIAWLQSTQTTKPTGNQPLHIGTLPGLIEPDD
jgi:putative membrane-bound dehydrogenase-like protein